MAKEPVNPYAPPTTQVEPAAEGPSDYASVPVLRRNGFCSGVILAHVAAMFLGGCVPFFALLGIVTTVGVLVVCVTVLTGPVYYNKSAPNGRLKTWGNANKVAAVIILVLFIGLYGFIVYSVMGDPASRAVSPVGTAGPRRNFVLIAAVTEATDGKSKDVGSGAVESVRLGVRRAGRGAVSIS